MVLPLLIDEVLEQVASRKWRSKIDLSDGYHNICIILEHEKYSVFLTHKGVYCSKVMEQEDCNAPSIIMRVMHDIFSDMDHCIICYLDDILIFSEIYEQHIKDVREVHRRLLKGRFWLNEHKSQFLPECMEVLRYVLINEGLSPLL